MEDWIDFPAPATWGCHLPPEMVSRVGLSALAQPRLTKGGQPYLETNSRGNRRPDDWLGVLDDGRSMLPGLRSPFEWRESSNRYPLTAYR
jgi:hypothetical protein